MQQLDSTQIAQVLARLSDGTIASVQETPPNTPATATAKWVFAALTPWLAKATYEDFLPAALKSSNTAPAPSPKVIGRGLGQLRTGLDELKRGVSTTKLAFTL